MNISELITSIKMDLGVYSVNIPVKDEELFDVIKLRTIKTYSQFFPHIVNIKVNVHELKKFESSYGRTVVELPDIFGDRRIMQVIEVDLDTEFHNSAHLVPEMNPNMDMFGNMMQSMAISHAVSAIAPQFTFNFIQPNRLELYNASSFTNILNIRVGLEHFDNLSSIPATAFESFYELALLDIKNFLYGILKHYDQLTTAHGVINLKIDDWSNASSDRRDLIERYRERSHLDTYEIFIH